MRSTPKCDIMAASSRGFVSMKTKIIYISGNEVFNMADIRAAFEEVRNTLGLGTDTIMFGVPVDNDDAFNNAEPTQPQQPAPISDDTDTMVPNTDSPAAEMIHPTDIPVSITDDTPVDKQPVKKQRGRPKRKDTEPAVATDSEMDTKSPDNNNDNNEKIIPILSILASKSDSGDKENVVPATADTHEETATQTVEPNSENDVKIDTASDTEIIADIDVSTELTTGIQSESNPEHVTIADMITDDAPSAPVEKTLEQLLESMTPLREDSVDEQFSVNDAEPDTNIDDITSDENNDSDATLERLAAEFAENQDKIPTETKATNHGKIGKLKNILPFKKAKRDDSGLMGDLFGWAGIAANDDDFSIPGFFTKAASKK